MFVLVWHECEAYAGYWSGYQRILIVAEDILNCVCGRLIITYWVIVDPTTCNLLSD